MKALAFCLGVRGFVRLLIQEPLALRAAKQCLGPIRVGDFAGVVPEIELCKVAVKMALRTVLIDALHAALEDREIAFESDSPARTVLLRTKSPRRSAWRASGSRRRSRQVLGVAFRGGTSVAF